MIAKLVNTTPVTMVYDIYKYNIGVYWGVRKNYKQTNLQLGKQKGVDPSKNRFPIYQLRCPQAKLWRPPTWPRRELPSQVATLWKELGE